MTFYYYLYVENLGYVKEFPPESEQDHTADRAEAMLLNTVDHFTLNEAWEIPNATVDELSESEQLRRNGAATLF